MLGLFIDIYSMYTFVKKSFVMIIIPLIYMFSESLRSKASIIPCRKLVFLLVPIISLLHCWHSNYQAVLRVLLLDCLLGGY